LKMFYCDNNQLTWLPNNLPNMLQQLGCFNNKLTMLPTNLPPCLKILCCSNNQLAALPDILPQQLLLLSCHHNQLTILPDLPNSLKHIICSNNPLTINYPQIYNFKKDTFAEFTNPQEVIAYVNECNSQRRTQTRARAITGELAELYYRRALHPSRLAHLLDNPEEDPNDFMDKLSLNI